MQVIFSFIKLSATLICSHICKSVCNKIRVSRFTLLYFVALMNYFSILFNITQIYLRNKLLVVAERRSLPRIRRLIASAWSVWEWKKKALKIRQKTSKRFTAKLAKRVFLIRCLPSRKKQKQHFLQDCWLKRHE